MNTPARSLALAVLLLLTLAGPAAAADPGGPVFGSYWQSFLEYWKGMFQKQSGVVMGVLGVGVIALFIITRGKWRK
jgi:TrbC/VIRB2 pilin